jgi:hypothetical protein
MSKWKYSVYKQKYNGIVYYKYYIILLLALILIYFGIESDEDYTESIKTRTIEKDGFCVLYNKIYSDKTTGPACPELSNDILSILPADYIFIDYVYKIQNAALSTFHRDVTSSQHINNTKHPVYTLILYKYDGELLSICPKSNQSYPFVWSRIVNIRGKKGTVFLFDSNILHAGCINKCTYRNVIQYKLCHKSDLSKLSTLQGVNMKKSQKCDNSIYNIILRKLSYYFEFPINYIFTPLLIKREGSNTIIGKIQSLIPMNYYNNY